MVKYKDIMPQKAFLNFAAGILHKFWGELSDEFHPGVF